VEKASGGKIKTRVFAGGLLLGFKETLRGLKDGVADTAHLVISYEPSFLPTLNMITDMLMLNDDAVAACGATCEILCLHRDFFEEEERKNGVVLFGCYGTYPYVMMSPKPIRSLNDLKGKKVRTGGPTWVRMCDYLGVVPVAISASEAFEALQRGTLDIVWGPLDYLYSFKLWDVAKYVTVYPIGGFNGTDTPTFSQLFWDKLPKVGKRIFIDHYRMVPARTTIDGYWYREAETKKQAQEKGVKFIEPDADLKKAIDEFKKKDIDGVVDFAFKNRKVPREKAQQIRDTYVNLYKKWDKISKEVVKEKRDKFEEMLYKEIYGPLTVKMGLIE
jgi:TRAP-type C4-dicarboxylate transport system substrate-binding protein